MSPFAGSARSTETWQHLRVTRQDGVATVTLARPDKLNALTFEAYADLRDLLAELSRERSVRALVLAGRGADSVPAAMSRRSSAPPWAWTPRNCWTSTG